MKKMDWKFAFIVLNYQCTDETIRCIESIEKLDYKEKYVVVVDNASDNQTQFFAEVRQHFAEETNISYLKSTQNTGYARGNNMGIDFAKNVLSADFICVINPDAVLPQTDFVQGCVSLYEEHEYAVLGPRIISGNHDANPIEIYNESTLKNFYATLFDVKVYYAKKYNLKRFNIARRIREKRARTEDADGKSASVKGMPTQDSAMISNQNAESTVHIGTYALNSDMGIMISGACMVFSPKFLSSFSGFCNKTFLYHEESILSCVCHHLGYKVLYSSNVMAAHDGGKSTEKVKAAAGDEDEKIMWNMRICILSLWSFTKVLAHKNNKRYLRKVLNPKVDGYEIVNVGRV